jgi:hypothetical protein
MGRRAANERGRWSTGCDRIAAAAATIANVRVVVGLQMVVVMMRMLVLVQMLLLWVVGVKKLLLLLD